MLFPLVNEDGSFDEVDLPGYYPCYRKPKMTEVKFTVSELIEDVEVQFDEYENMQLGFEVAKGKRANVVIYVHTEYMKWIQKEDRQLFLESELKKSAPWIFTYGKREFYRHF